MSEEKNKEGIAKTGAIELRDKGFAPKNLDEAYRLAKVMAKSSLVPKEYRGKEADVLVAMQWGHELGLAPLQALQNIAVINGRPSIWGDSALALVLASGQVEYFEEWEENVEGEGLTAFCKTKRKGSFTEQVRTFSEQDVKTAGLGNVHKTYPKRMRQMRARGFLIRDVYPDALKGLITREEAMDYPASAAPRDVTPDEQRLPDITKENDTKAEGKVEAEVVEAVHFPNPSEEERDKDEGTREDTSVGTHGVDVPEAMVEPAPSEEAVKESTESTGGTGAQLTEQMRKAVTARRRYGWSIKKVEDKYGVPFERLEVSDLKEIAEALKACKTDKDAVGVWLGISTPPQSQDNEFDREVIMSEIEELILEGEEAGYDKHDYLGIPRNWEEMAPKLSTDILVDLRDDMRTLLNK